MEQISNDNGNTPAEVSAINRNTPVEVSAVEADEPAKNTDRQVQNFNSNLLYEESLGFIPGTLRGKQDPQVRICEVSKTVKGI